MSAVKKKKEAAPRVPVNKGSRDFLYTQLAFAELAGVTKGAVSSAMRSGTVVKSKGSKIDITDIINKNYLAAAANRQELEASGGKPKTVSIESAKPRGLQSKHAAELERIQEATLKLKLNNALTIGEVVRRDDVNKMFGAIAAVVLSHFHPMGERLAPLVAGIGGVKDQKRVIAIKKKIDDEVTRALKEIKRATEKNFIGKRKRKNKS